MNAHRFLLTGLMLALAGAAHADITDPGNQVLGGTMTVQGNAFSVGGSTLVVTSGSVGIGTSTPSQMLEILGGNAFVHSNNTSRPGYVIKHDQASTGYVLGIQNDGRLNLSGYTPNDDFDNNTGGGINLTAGGNVGVNTKTPGTTLDVGGAGTVRGAFTVSTASATIRGAYPQLVLDNPTSGAGSEMEFRNAGSTAGVIGHISLVNALQFSGGTAASVHMTITGGGLVGIGTTSPALPLDVTSTAQGIGLPILTTAQTQASTPGRAGALIYNSTIAAVCVSTGTTVQGYARISNGATCQ